MKVRAAALAFFVLILVSARAALAANAATDRKLNGWYMRQQHQLIGASKITVSADGLRVDNDTYGYVYIRKNGDTDYIVYNAKNKVYFVGRGSSRTMGRVEMMAIFSTKEFDELNWKVRKFVKSGHAIICGVATRRYSFTSPSKSSWNFYVADLGLPAWEYKEHSEWQRMPELGGWTLRCDMIRPNESFVRGLDTLELKKVRVNKAVFELPKGFRQTKSMIDVCNARTNTMLRDLVEDLTAD